MGEWDESVLCLAQVPDPGKALENSRISKCPAWDAYLNKGRLRNL
jgi:hypothetical protein